MLSRSLHRFAFASLAVIGAGCASPPAHEAAPLPPAAAAGAQAASPASAPPAAQEMAKPLAPVPAKGKAEQELENGIKSYDLGAYKAAAKHLRNALALGLEAHRDQAAAHKYLAFMHCMSGRKKACGDEFRKAFAVEPGFDLEPAEAGHPMWGPVFRNVKAQWARSHAP